MAYRNENKKNFNRTDNKKGFYGKKKDRERNLRNICRRSGVIPISKRTGESLPLRIRS